MDRLLQCFSSPESRDSVCSMNCAHTRNCYIRPDPPHLYRTKVLFMLTLTSSMQAGFAALVRYSIPLFRITSYIPPTAASRLDCHIQCRPAVDALPCANNEFDARRSRFCAFLHPCAPVLLISCMGLPTRAYTLVCAFRLRTCPDCDCVSMSQATGSCLLCCRQRFHSEELKQRPMRE